MALVEFNGKLPVVGTAFYDADESLLVSVTHRDTSEECD